MAFLTVGSAIGAVAGFVLGFVWAILLIDLLFETKGAIRQFWDARFFVFLIVVMFTLFGFEIGLKLGGA
jgi:hypothetical protein